MTDARDGLVELTLAEAGETNGGSLWTWLFGEPEPTGFQFGGGGGFGGGGAGGSW